MELKHLYLPASASVEKTRCLAKSLHLIAGPVPFSPAVFSLMLWSFALCTTRSPQLGHPLPSSSLIIRLLHDFESPGSVVRHVSLNTDYCQTLDLEFTPKQEIRSGCGSIEDIKLRDVLGHGCQGKHCRFMSYLPTGSLNGDPERLGQSVAVGMSVDG